MGYNKLLVKWREFSTDIAATWGPWGPNNTQDTQFHHVPYLIWCFHHHESDLPAVAQTGLLPGHIHSKVVEPLK